ncbi:hypothetical protein V8E53_010399 [Lactarius tabidus]
MVGSSYASHSPPPPLTDGATRFNSTLFVPIQNPIANAQISTLHVANISLRVVEIALGAQFKKRGKNSQPDEELRREPAPKAHFPVLNQDALPHANRLARPPRFLKRFEEDEDVPEDNRCQGPILMTHLKEPHSTSSASQHDLVHREPHDPSLSASTQSRIRLTFTVRNARLAEEDEYVAVHGHRRVEVDENAELEQQDRRRTPTDSDSDMPSSALTTRPPLSTPGTTPAVSYLLPLPGEDTEALTTGRKRRIRKSANYATPSRSSTSVYPNPIHYPILASDSFTQKDAQTRSR